MTPMFTILAKEPVVKLEMSTEELQLAIELTQFINNNASEDEFFTIKNASPDDLQGLLTVMRSTLETSSDEGAVSLSLSQSQYRIFSGVFLYADRCFDEKQQFEQDYDTIVDIADSMRPK